VRVNAEAFLPFLGSRPFLAGVVLGLIPSVDFVLRLGGIFTFDLPVRQSLFTILVLFVLMSLLHGAFSVIMIRLSTTLERQFVDVARLPDASTVQYRNVKNRILLGVILFSYALLLLGRFVDIPILFLFGWAIPGIAAAAVVLITPVAWAMRVRRTH